ncbi:hypothetical protein WCP94_000332 (plasmid) [Bilophila wadsworthia]
MCNGKKGFSSPPKPTPPPKAFDVIESLLAGVPDMVGRGGAAMAKRRVSPPLVFEGDVGLWT